jgi:hypothetical protein
MLLGLCCLALAASGCGARTGTLSGKVSYQGKPVTRGTVTLFCADGHILSGFISPEGTYSIPRVPLGDARITVATYPPVPRGFNLPQQLPPSNGTYPRETAALPATTEKFVPLPERYKRPNSSGLAVTVRRSDEVHDLQLEF